MDQIEYAQHAELNRRYRGGANWFYWIAGLTIVTSLIAAFGGGWRFLLSLGTTQIIDAVAQEVSTELGSAPKVIALVLDLIVSGTFVVIGYLANKKYLWAYMAGMVVFLLDGLVTLVIQDWIGVIAHGVVLFFMFPGFQAGRELVRFEQAMAQSPPETAPQPEVAV
jgi:hypothetical protein